LNLNNYPLGYIKPTEVSADEPFVQILRDIGTEVLSFTPDLGACLGWTDLRFFDEIGIKTIPGFGPGLTSVNHSTKEYVEIKSLIEALKIYSLAACSYLGN